MILPDKEFFNYKECEIAGDKCWLITPNHIGVKWTDENARFRSCIVRQSDNFVVSQGFAKFVNFHEQPDFQPWDESWPIEARHKMDGSLLIISSYKGQWIVRTRGTVDARQLSNGHEIDFLMKKYEDFFNCCFAKTLSETLGNSFLFEWTTPTNIIVIKESDEPNLTLLGIVSHDNCEYMPQDIVDMYVKNYPEGYFNRPQKYTYDSIKECLADVAAWKGKEGVVLYSPDGQTLKKIKSEEYLRLHYYLSQYASINKLLDLFFLSGKNLKNIDYEILNKNIDCLTHINNIYEFIIHELKLINGELNKQNFSSQKDKALYIISHYKEYQHLLFNPCEKNIKNYVKSQIKRVSPLLNIFDV